MAAGVLVFCQQRFYQTANSGLGNTQATAAGGARRGGRAAGRAGAAGRGGRAERAAHPPPAGPALARRPRARRQGVPLPALPLADVRVPCYSCARCAFTSRGTCARPGARVLAVKAHPYHMPIGCDSLCFQERLGTSCVGYIRLEASENFVDVIGYSRLLRMYRSSH